MIPGQDDVEYNVLLASTSKISQKQDLHCTCSLIIIFETWSFWKYKLELGQKIPASKIRNYYKAF